MLIHNKIINGRIRGSCKSGGSKVINHKYIKFALDIFCSYKYRTRYNMFYL